MKTQIIFLLLLGITAVTAVTHSMTYIVTAAIGMDEFPEHNEVGLVDGQEFVHYDSNLKKIIPKTAWIEQNVGADYWERETDRNINTQQVFKANIGTAMQRFNQTGGVHVVQYMYGCEWDDETGEVKGYRQYGYDGEDFIVWDTKSHTWIAPRQQAVLTQNKWNGEKAQITYLTSYLTQLCPEWGKKYVDYGKSSLLRTDLPSVSLLQKTPSSPVSCHATGFYPDKAEMFWRKDGEQLHEDVEHGEILPNKDGTFQMSVDLKLSVKPEDWSSYDCVFQLSGAEKDIVTELEKVKIRTNEKSTNMTIIIIIIAVVVLLSVIAGIGFYIYRQKNAKRPPSPVSDPGVMEQLNPAE